MLGDQSTEYSSGVNAKESVASVVAVKNLTVDLQTAATVDPENQTLVEHNLIRERTSCCLIYNIITFFVFGGWTLFGFVNSIVLMAGNGRYLCATQRGMVEKENYKRKYLHSIHTAAIALASCAIVESVIYMFMGPLILHETYCTYSRYSYDSYCSSYVNPGGVIMILMGTFAIIYAIVQIVLSCRIKSAIAKTIKEAEPCCCYPQTPCEI